MALERIRTDPPDVILLDLEMPRLDGLTFLRHLMATHPIPVVVCSAHASAGSTERAVLRAGARQVIRKPPLAVRNFLEDSEAELEGALRRAAASRSRPVLQPSPSAPSAAPGPGQGAGPSTGSIQRVILLGASMGGPAALRSILSGFPADAPPCLVVQHMQGSFTRDFARRLDAAAAPEVREATGRESLVPGRVLVAPGDRHLVVTRSDRGEVRAEVVGGDPVQGHRPSVDVLFHSAAEVLGPRAVSALLTGMGRDGAEGLLAMRRAGARTFAQAREGCTVFGMPGAAAELGAAELSVPLDVLGSALLTASGYDHRSRPSSPGGRWPARHGDTEDTDTEVGSA
jgi:two-component system chemotaxis response regulator CheB